MYCASWLFVHAFCLSAQPLKDVLWAVLPYVFWAIALGWSVFYACSCFAAFLVDTPGAEEVLGKFGHKKRLWYVHQWWFNFVGSIAGWFALWICLTRNRESTSQISASDVGLGFVAFVGITGHLPYAIAGILDGLHDVAKAGLDKLAEWMKTTTSTSP